LLPDPVIIDSLWLNTSSSSFIVPKRFLSEKTPLS
jgi:hypothetical protein